VSSSASDITQLLLEVSRGDQQALGQMLPLVYGELRALAERALRRERAGHTLQPTALVHEAYIKLVDQSRVQWQNRAHFYAVAAQIMRRILVDHARARQAAKRDGAGGRIALEDTHAAPREQPPDLMALDEALTRLGELDQRQGRVVELRFFAGLTNEETAEVLGVSPATVKREWTTAKAWLRREMERA